MCRSYRAATTAADVIEGMDLQDLAVRVTGAFGGLGLETARALALQGASVTRWTLSEQYSGEQFARGACA